MELEEQAKTIESGFEDLKKQYKNPDEKKKIKIDNIVTLMEYMVGKFTEPNGIVFAKGFLGHLYIITKLAENDSNGWVDHFTEISRLLCEMCSKTELDWAFFSTMLAQWFDFGAKLSFEMRNSIFNELKSSAFVNCAHFLINAPCISLKFQLLNILCAYLEFDASPMTKISALFDGIADESAMKFISSIEWNADERNLSLNDKYLIIDRINHMSKQSIYSELVDIFEFGNAGKKIIFKQNDGRLFFNKLTKTIEFYVSHESNMILVTISEGKIHNVQVIDSGNCFAKYLKLILRKPPHFKTINGKRIEVPEYQVTTIDVKFYKGILKSQLDSLLLDMFKIVPETLNRSIESGNESNDSDIEMIVLSPKSSRYVRPIRPPKQQQPAKPIDAKKTRARRTIPNQPGSVKANQNIDIYEFNDYDTIRSSSRRGSKRKVNNIPKSPSSVVTKYIGLGSKNRNAKNVEKPGNEIECNNNNNDDDDTQKSPAKHEFTSPGFPKSMDEEDPESQDSQTLENTTRKRAASESKRLKTVIKANDLSGDNQEMKMQQHDMEQSAGGENTEKNLIGKDVRVD